MEKEIKSLNELRKRKLLLAVPLLTLPFISTLFWLLGGGQMETATASTMEQKGFNVALPDPSFNKEGLLDKMSYYEQAISDSAKIKELIEKDPNYQKYSFIEESIGIENDSIVDRSEIRKSSGALNTTIYRDAHEEKVHKKLETLQKLINQPIGAPKEHSTSKIQSKQSVGVGDSKDVDRLEQMMQAMNQSDAEDPELKKLSGMLENILDIQHPDRVQEKLRKTSQANKGQVFSISRQGNEQGITSLQNTKDPSGTGGGMQKASNAFYSFEDALNIPSTQNAVEAVIHETQTLVNGSIVKFRLNHSIFVNGIMIPKDNFLFGVAALKGERLTVKISSLRYGNSIFPVELSVYDMDGLEGIYIPGAINREVAKTAADRSMQTLGVASLDESWGAQAAGASIEAAKSLLSKKVKQVKVMVKSGYQVLVRDENQKDKN
jgi:conjugative transposon TraM protein